MSITDEFKKMLDDAGIEAPNAEILVDYAQFAQAVK